MENHKKHNFTPGQLLDLTIKTERGGVIYSDVVVRIADHYRMRVHLDTDEGNAAGITEQSKGILTLEK